MMMKRLEKHVVKQDIIMSRVLRNLTGYPTKYKQSLDCSTTKDTYKKSDFGSRGMFYLCSKKLAVRYCASDLAFLFAYAIASYLVAWLICPRTSPCAL